MVGYEAAGMMAAPLHDLLLAIVAPFPPAAVAGGVVGLSLGLTGGGGAMVGAVERARYGQGELSTGLLFAAAGSLARSCRSFLQSQSCSWRHSSS